MSDALGAARGAWAGCSEACGAAAPLVVDCMQHGGAMGFFFLAEKFTCATCDLSYMAMQPLGGGEGPARGARAPVPAGRCGGGAARRAFSRLQGMPRRGGRQRGALVGGQGGLGSRLCVRAGRGHTGAWYTYKTYTVSGAGAGTRAPWPPSWPFWRGVSRSGTGGPSRRGEGHGPGHRWRRVGPRRRGGVCGAACRLPLRAWGGGALRGGPAGGEGRHGLRMGKHQSRALASAG